MRKMIAAAALAATTAFAPVIDEEPKDYDPKDAVSIARTRIAEAHAGLKELHEQLIPVCQSARGLMFDITSIVGITAAKRDLIQLLGDSICYRADVIGYHADLVAKNGFLVEIAVLTGRSVDLNLLVSQLADESVRYLRDAESDPTDVATVLNHIMLLMEEIQ